MLKTTLNDLLTVLRNRVKALKKAEAKQKDIHSFTDMLSADDRQRSVFEAADLAEDAARSLITAMEEAIASGYAITLYRRDGTTRTVRTLGHGSVVGASTTATLFMLSAVVASPI